MVAVNLMGSPGAGKTAILEATARASPGSISIQRKSASAAMKSSTSMPAAPTTTRRRRSGKALAAEAST